MTVSVVGWYGTETQGDIAILDGIFTMLSELDSIVNVKLGSLYKFYTERTLLLNRDVFKINSSNVDVDLFDIKDEKERTKSINESDLLLIGGGPLDNIREILLLEKCFKIADRKKIPSMIFGCGIDVLTDQECISSLKSISSISKMILVRDEKTKEKFLNLFAGVQDKIFVIQDPAILSIVNYKLKVSNTLKKNNSVSINIRRYTSAEYLAPVYYSDQDFVTFIESVASHFEKVNLVPMHTFYCGEDDRYYLSRLNFQINKKNVTVMHRPLTLYELYNLFQTSFGCVGMRYHSVVIQTILNGNNLIFDYTDPKNGKIVGFLRDNNLVECYNGRICHLQNREVADLSDFSGRIKDCFSPVNVSYDSEFVVNLIKDVVYDRF